MYLNLITNPKYTMQKTKSIVTKATLFNLYHVIN